MLLVGGVVRSELSPLSVSSLRWQSLDLDDFVLPPLPNTLFQRDNSAWIYRGLTISHRAVHRIERHGTAPAHISHQHRHSFCDEVHRPLHPDITRRLDHADVSSPIDGDLAFVDLAFIDPRVRTTAPSASTSP